MERYGDKISIFIVYNFEAHPIIDDPPYLTNNENANAENEAEGIQYRQPRTYGERKAIAGDMVKAMMISVPIIFDGPCNEWSAYYGPAPNNAYLINTDGVIAAKHGWFDRFPDDIILDIEKLLNETNGNNSARDTGIFSLQLESTDTARGLPGTTVQVVGKMVNESDADAVIKVKRIHTDLPSGWKTSLCTDVCFNTTVDSTLIRVLPHSEQEIKIYFYTSNTAEEGNVTLNFASTKVSSNEVTVDFHAITTQNLGTPQVQKKNYASISLFPSPVRSRLQLHTRLPYSQTHIVDGFGRTVLEEGRSCYHDLSSLSSGIYFIQLFSDEGLMVGTARFLKE